MTPVERLSTEEEAPALSVAPARLLSQKEAAEWLNVSRRTLEAWRARGKNLPWVKVGKLVRYRPGDLEKFVRRNLHQGRRTA